MLAGIFFVDSNKRQHAAIESVAMIKQDSSDAQFVYEALCEDFVDSHAKWKDPPSSFSYKIKLPTIVSPLRRYSEKGIILFFPGKLPSAQEVAQWIQSTLGGPL